VLPNYCYAARSHVARFYKPIDHAVLLEQCKRMGVSQVSQSIVSQYLPRPENKKTRKQENKKTRKQENKKTRKQVKA